MKKHLLIVCITVSLLFLAAFTPAFAQQKGITNPCELFTKAEAEGIFKEAMSEGKADKTSMPAGFSCKYSYKKKGATYGVTVKVATADTLKQEGMYGSAKDVFTRQKKARMSSENTAKKVRVIPGLGDDAFWNGFDLWILKGGTFINIVSSSYLAGSFKSSEAMEKARYDQDLALAQKVAEKVIPRIK